MAEDFDFALFYQLGGAWMHAIFLLGMLTGPLGLIALLLRTRVTAVLALLAALACLGLGYAGYADGMAETREALAVVAQDQYEMAREFGTRVARIPLIWGACWSAPGLLGGLVALVFPKRRRTTD